MSGKFSDLLGQYMGLTHRRAVYGAMHEFIQRYLPNDLGPPQETLSVSDGLFSVVGEGVLEEIAVEVEMEIRRLTAELEAFEQLPAKPAVKAPKARTTKARRSKAEGE